MPTNVDSLDRNMKAPMAVNYVVGVEHQLPGRLVAGANYSGSRSFNALTGADVNRLPGDASVAWDCRQIRSKRQSEPSEY